MDNMLKEIREHFAANQVGLRLLTKLPTGYPAYTFRIGNEFGVAIEFESQRDFFEESTNALMSTKKFVLQGGKSTRYLTLSCCEEGYRNEFAEFCAHFVDPGKDGDNRHRLLDTPLNWWNQWIGLLGNRKGSSKCYDVIAEMMALDLLFRIDNTVVWSASHEGSHDIESSTKSYEVKSTLKKSETTVTISSQHQLFSTRELNLLFFRLEHSEQGVSINDMKEILVGHGYQSVLLEAQLNYRGFVKGSSLRDQKFRLLEARSYNVDDNFPRIVKSSFKGDVYPKNIIKILYTIDLEGLNYTNLDWKP